MDGPRRGAKKHPKHCFPFGKAHKPTASARKSSENPREGRRSRMKWDVDKGRGIPIQRQETTAVHEHGTHKRRVERDTGTPKCV